MVQERKTKEETLPDLEAVQIQAELREAPPAPDEPVVTAPTPEPVEKQAEGNRCTACTPAS